MEINSLILNRLLKKQKNKTMTIKCILKLLYKFLYCFQLNCVSGLNKMEEWLAQCSGIVSMQMCGQSKIEPCQ